MASDVRGAAEGEWTGPLAEECLDRWDEEGTRRKFLFASEIP